MYIGLNDWHVICHKSAFLSNFITKYFNQMFPVNYNYAMRYFNMAWNQDWMQIAPQPKPAATLDCCSYQISIGGWTHGKDLKNCLWIRKIEYCVQKKFFIFLMIYLIPGLGLLLLLFKLLDSFNALLYFVTMLSLLK